METTGSKHRDNMRSNTTRTSTSSTTTKSVQRKSSDTESESAHGNLHRKSNNSNSNSTARSHSRSPSRSHSTSRTNLDAHGSTRSNSASQANSRSYSKSYSTSNCQSNSTTLPSVVCIEGNKSVFATMVGRVVKHSIFPKKQFLIFERELDENGKVAESCVKALSLERSQWYSVKNIVRVRLNRVRNNAQLCVRKRLYRYMEEHGVDSINLERVLEGRKNRDSFHWFLDHIASTVVSTRVAEQVKCIKRPSEWLTRSLEAFSLLCLENYYEMTRKQIMNKDTRDKYQALWTSDGRGKLKNQGWDQAGIRRYNALCEMVKVDREKYEIEDRIYLSAKQDERLKMEMSKLKRKQDRTETREQGLEADRKSVV